MEIRQWEDHGIVVIDSSNVLIKIIDGSNYEMRLYIL